MSTLIAPATTRANDDRTGPHLFRPMTLRSVTLRNRIVVSPMCQYSADDGFANDWHLVHLGSRAVGGAGVVVVEATAVEARGRITTGDLGIWTDQHIEPLARIARFLKSQGAVAAIQLAHAGRKASTAVPWLGGRPILEGEDAWQPVAPSAIPFADGYAVPRELSRADIREIVSQFRSAARRSLDAGFQIVEIHAAHGYLLHEFFSPLSNQRSDEYGGSFANRVRLTLEIVEAVREVWPENLPIFLRISATDWIEGGWTAEDSVALSRLAQPLGVDLIDCSSGGNAAHAHIPVGPGYQAPFAAQIRRDTGVATAAVGMITDPQQAEGLLANGDADLVILAREFLREPYWPFKAAEALGVERIVPAQYQRAFMR